MPLGSCWKTKRTFFPLAFQTNYSLFLNMRTILTYTLKSSSMAAFSCPQLWCTAHTYKKAMFWEQQSVDPIVGLAVWGWVRKWCMNELKFSRGKESLFCSKQSQLFVAIFYPYFHLLGTVQFMNKWTTNTSDALLCLWCLYWYSLLPVSLVLFCVHLVILPFCCTG